MHHTPYAIHHTLYTIYHVPYTTRWTKVLNPTLTKGPWTPQEDEKVRELVLRFGAKKWSAIAAQLPGRLFVYET
ncbi:hypothetical protein EON63_15975 [archaeon]|nr:MAG: hypothetical protein EON63_15975 [archaeon]